MTLITIVLVKFDVICRSIEGNVDLFMPESNIFRTFIKSAMIFTELFTFYIFLSEIVLFLIFFSPFLFKIRNGT